MRAMDGSKRLERRIEELSAKLARLEAENVDLRAAVVQRDARIAELEKQLRHRGKKYTFQANASRRGKDQPDRRRRPYRRHPGSTRPEPPAHDAAILHEVRLDECPCCGGAVEPTGQFDERYVEDLPEPKVEVHCYRRHVYRCSRCQRSFHGRADLDVPGATVGDRARLLTVYSRAQLGISLGKTTQLMQDLFGLQLSRAGALGHLRWFDRLFHPVVGQLLALLRQAAVVHADETGWRIDGRNVWCWCFSNPRIAVFLIDEHRSSEVVRRALGDSLPGVLVSDFYAAYHAIDCRKQRCLVHLLRELAKLRDELPAAAVARHLRPLTELFQDAIALGHRREELPAAEFRRQRDVLVQRLDERWWRQSNEPDCQRIYDRLRRHRDELLVFLDEPEVPADNNLSERDIRSVAATRADGGVNRSAWGARAFAVAKSIVRTCQKNGYNFFQYAQSVIDTLRRGAAPHLPLVDSS
jgi:hypothetical protein